MTAVWGPLGWMTLHSISVCYPIEPTISDKKLLNEFMDAFGMTITCSICNDHFSKMFSGYKKAVPNWNNSRYDLFIAICKMHNTVNTRLNKPCPKTIGECLTMLQTATKYSPPSEFRKKYIEYLNVQWRHFLGLKQKVDLMKKINEEYWNFKETPYSSIDFDTTVDTITYSNQDVYQKVIFPKLSIRNVRWNPLA
jgi:hypothetical protein